MRFRGLRLFLKWCAAGLIGVVLLLLCSDWWLPPVLPAVLKRWDVEVASVSRVAAGRWELRELRYEMDGLVVTGDVLRVPNPFGMVQAYWRGSIGESILVELGVFTVRLPLGEATEPVDLVGVLAEVRSTLAAYEEWLPAVVIDTVTIVSDEATVVTLNDFRFKGGELAGAVESPHLSSVVQVEADIREADAWELRIDAEAMGLGAEMDLSFAEADRVALAIRLEQGEERLEGRAVWLRGEQLPSEFFLKSDDFSVRSRWFSGLGAMQVERIRVTDLEVSWAGGRYQGRVELTTDLRMADHDVLPVQALFAVSGDLGVLSVETCEISGAWGQLALGNTLEVNLSERLVLQGAELTASLDLSKQPWVPATGHLGGRVRVEPDHSEGWDVGFDLEGEALNYGGFEVNGVVLAGEVQGSTITLERLQLDLLEDTNAESVSISGVVDLALRTMDLQYRAAIGAEWLNAVLGNNYFADMLEGEGRVSGSFDQPQLEGQLKPVTLLHPELNPVTLAGEVRSLSEGAFDVELSAKCNGAEVSFDLAASRKDGLCVGELQAMVIEDPELATLSLPAPARMTYRADAGIGERLHVDSLDLVGEDSALHVSWDGAMGVSLSVRNMTSKRFDRWLKKDLPLYQFDAIDVALTQLQPRILGSVAMHAQTEVVVGEPLRIDLVGRLEADGVMLDQVAVEFQEGSLLSGNLSLPLRLQLPSDASPLFEPIPNGSFSGELNGWTTPAFSEWLARQSGIQVGDAEVGLSVSGNWADPQGTLNLHVAEIDLGERVTAGHKLPVITDLEVKARLGVQLWELERFECRVNESLVTGNASLPADAVLWTDEAIDWKAIVRQLSARIALEDWKFEKWLHLFPEEMRQSGELDAALELKPGLDLSGRLILEDFALRPTQAYSTIDQIGAELVLTDRKIEVKRASARVGGSPVEVRGWIDGTDLETPLWEFTAVGKRVPLVRSNDLILRSDVDLLFRRLTTEAVPRLSGELNFRQSTLLVEFDPLAPRVERGPSRRPPYFSITAPEIADWEFDLVGKGDSFLRVRSPYFRALISASMTLKGTFIKPELTGGVRVTSGDILFPSVKMELDAGEAFIEPTRPNEVQLEFSGIAQVSSYVITMEVEQTLDDPSVFFSSTPTLPNTEIIRLLATGGLSGGEVGSVGVYLGKGILGVGAVGANSSLADRLTIDVGEAGGRDGGNTFGVQYRINDSLYLNGGYDIYEAYNLDLLWSIFKQ